MEVDFKKYNDGLVSRDCAGFCHAKSINARIYE